MFFSTILDFCKENKRIILKILEKIVDICNPFPTLNLSQLHQILIYNQIFFNQNTKHILYKILKQFKIFSFSNSSNINFTI